MDDLLEGVTKLVDCPTWSPFFCCLVNLFDDATVLEAEHER